MELTALKESSSEDKWQVLVQEVEAVDTKNGDAQFSLQSRFFWKAFFLSRAKKLAGWLPRFLKNI